MPIPRAQSDLERSRSGGWVRWPQFWGLTFHPESLFSETSGGLIAENEEDAAAALALDLQYLLDLFQLIREEKRLKSFWSPSHRAWVFFSEQEIKSLGTGPRSLCSYVLRKFKKKDAFYEEILARSGRLPTL
jgi:hypothetical protein